MATDEKNESFNALSDLAYKLISNKKKSAAEVKSILIEKGMVETKANSLVDNIQFHIKTQQEKAQKDIEYGSITFLVGVIITGGTYLLSDYLNFYILTWGFIITGAFLFIRGHANKN